MPALRPIESFVFVPGIHADAADSRAWPPRAEDWFERHTGLKCTHQPIEIQARNRWRKMPAAVADLYARLVNRYGHPGDANFPDTPADDRPWGGVVPVGHSNGAEAIARLLREFPAAHFHTVHLIGAACDASFRKNGLNDAIESGRVTRVVVWASPDDDVLRCLATWSQRIGGLFGLGFGNLGYLSTADDDERRRLRLQGAIPASYLKRLELTPFAAHCVRVLPFCGYGHSDYFDRSGGRFDRTMAELAGRAA